MQEYEQELDVRINSLIRQDEIDAPMSISLMNDAGYAFDMAKNLLAMGEILFASGDRGLREAERSVTLNEADVD